MRTTLWSSSLLAARLAASTQLDRATHLSKATRAQLHLDILNTTSSVDDGWLSDDDALERFRAIRGRLERETAGT